MAIYQVNIVSMNVTSVDDGLTGGDHLEATFTFTVNGRVQLFKKDIGTGVHDIGFAFIVDVPLPQSQIRVSASGVEDDTIADDTLPGFTQIWGENLNWGEGSHTVSKSDGDISYALTYEIILTSESVSLVSSQSLLAYAASVAKLRGKRRPSDRQALAWSINRVARSGWKLVQMRDEEVVFKGAGPFLGLIDEKFGEKSGEPTGEGKYKR